MQQTVENLNPKERSKTLALLFANFALFGWVAASIGATLPGVVRSMSWTYQEMGLVIAANSAGFFMSTFLSGMAAHRMGFGTMLAAGLALQGAGVWLFGAHGAFMLNLGLFFLLGVGQGLIEVATNYSAAQFEIRGQSRMMNLVHAGFTVGAVLAPVFCGFILKRGLGWRAIYISMGVFCALMLLAVLIRRDAFPEPVTESGSSFKRMLVPLKHPLVLLLALTMFLYVGVEIGISSWIAEYFVAAFDASDSAGALMVSVFWLGVLIGRAVFFLSSWSGDQSRMLLILAAFSNLALFGAVYLKLQIASAGFFLLTGLAFSAIYPTIMILAGHSLESGRGMAIGAIATSGGIGLCFLPFLMSALSETAGIRFGFQFYFFLSVLMTLSALAARSVYKSSFQKS